MEKVGEEKVGEDGAEDGGEMRKRCKTDAMKRNNVASA